MFKTPDITPAQIVGIVAAALATATAFGVDLTATQQHVLLADAAAVAALFIGDAAIRHGRATGNAQKEGTSVTVEATDEQVHKAVAGVISAMAASSKRETGGTSRGKAAE